MQNTTLENPKGNPKMGVVLLTTENPVFCCYLFWASLLIVKLLMMSILTAIKRVMTKTFANPEDVKMNKGDDVKFGNPGVERVRRAHRNDLENVVPFLIMALLYVAAGPKPMMARIFIRIGACMRILHTLVYAFRPIPQPSRAICFFTTFFITIFMAFYSIICFGKYI